MQRNILYAAFTAIRSTCELELYEPANFNRFKSSTCNTSDYDLLQTTAIY